MELLLLVLFHADRFLLASDIQVVEEINLKSFKLSCQQGRTLEFP